MAKYIVWNDGGGIYTLGISPGTVIRNNIVHDVIPTRLMPQDGTGSIMTKARPAPGVPKRRR